MEGMKYSHYAKRLNNKADDNKQCNLFDALNVHYYVQSERV